MSHAHISKSERCFNVKSSTYYFHMKTNKLAEFQICIRVPLISYQLLTKPLRCAQAFFYSFSHSPLRFNIPFS